MCLLLIFQTFLCSLVWSAVCISYGSELCPVDRPRSTLVTITKQNLKAWWNLEVRHTFKKKKKSSAWMPQSTEMPKNNNNKKTQTVFILSLYVLKNVVSTKNKCIWTHTATNELVKSVKTKCLRHTAEWVCACVDLRTLYLDEVHWIGHVGEFRVRFIIKCLKTPWLSLCIHESICNR